MRTTGSPRTVALLISLLLLLFVAGCASPTPEPPPSPTPLPLLDQTGAIPARTESVLEATSTPVPTLPPAEEAAPPALPTSTPSPEAVTPTPEPPTQEPPPVTTPEPAGEVTVEAQVETPLATAEKPVQAGEELTNTVALPIVVNSQGTPVTPEEAEAEAAEEATPGVTPAEETSPEATLEATPEAAILPPVLLFTEPPAGETWDGGPVVFHFDQPLDPESGEALSVEPPLPGQVTVEDARLVFTPEEEPALATRYRFVIDGAKLRSAAGVALEGVLEIHLPTRVPLQVTSTQPTDGSQDVSPTSPVVVVFNQPVVPLVGLEEQAELPNPLTFEPSVAGSGRWLNTSVFAFQPEPSLAGGAQYTVVVAGVTSVDGAPLAEPAIFTFTTASPAVVEASPLGELAPPDATIQVQFNQPMDRESTEAAFALVRVGHDGKLDPVSGTFQWDEEQTRLTFTPDEWLMAGAFYQIHVGTGARDLAGQNGLAEPYVGKFRVAPLPRVERTDPEDGAVNVPPDRVVTVEFNVPMSGTTVLENVQIQPPITATTVYSYYSPYQQRLILDWAKAPRTAYTVTLGAAMQDEYGHPLGQDYVFRFTTGDLAPFVRLSTPRFTHFSAFTKTTVSLYHRNMPEVEVGLYRLSEKEFLRLTGDGSWEIWRDYRPVEPQATLIWEQTWEPDTPRNEIGTLLVDLVDEEGQPLPPGLYFLQTSRPPATPSTPKETPFQPAQSVLVLSNDNLVVKKSAVGESLAWQTSLLTGEPVPDQEVRFFLDRTPLGQAVTDAEGVAAAALALDPENPWLNLVAISGQPGDEHFSVATTAWDEGVGPWEFDVPFRSDVDRARLAFYTDRPIYRPGQTVYWKGIVRLIEADAYKLPPEGLTVQVLIRDGRGTVLFDQELPLNEHGTVFGELPLAEEAVTGYYSLEARLPLETGQEIYGGASFQVAEYRKPEFQIQVTTDQPEYVQGDTISVTLEARYFSGEPLADAPVIWSLLAEPYFFSWKDAPKGRYFRFDPVLEEDLGFNPFGGYYGGLLQEGTGVTGADGTFVFQLPADLGESLRSQRWTFDVTVQSPTGQFVSGRTSAPVHRGQFYIGLSPRQYVGQVGDPLDVDVVTVTPQGEPAPDVPLELVVHQVVWNSVYEKAPDGTYYWTSTVERTPVFTTSLTTDEAGAGLLTWTPEQGGQYLVTAAGEDQAGNAISSGAFVWVQAEDPRAFIPWRRENNDRMELVRDKDLYQPGDTAKVLVPSPFSGPVYALVTLERSGILERKVMVLESNSETLEIPITEEHIPNIYVSVVLVKGVDETNPIPALRVGYVELPVDASAKELAIQVQVMDAAGQVLEGPEAPRFQPGDVVSYLLTVTDQAGEPVPGAELSAALIDKAVLSLAAGYDPPLLDRFYARAPLGVDTGALLVINQDRLNQQLPEGAKGGGGGGEAGLLELRQRFADVAYWQADLVTDELGQVGFSVTLPDNLTTWRLIVRAISDDTLVGDASYEVVATKDLLIRPALPRFFTAGDRARIGALVRNTTAQALETVDVTLAVEGATFVTGDAESPQRVTQLSLDPGGQARFDQLIAVDPLASQVVVTYTAVAGDLQDAVRLELPVVRYETPEVVATAGTVPPEGRLEVIYLPEAATENGELQVILEPSLAAGMLEGLDYLTHFPYECTEQAVSRFLPNLMTMRALNRLGVSNPELEEQLAFQLGVGLQKLVNFQNPDGGWGWWPNSQSNPFITAYVLWGLWTADQEGYPVPETVLDQGVRFLERNFQAPDQVQEAWQLNEMAFIHFVLSEMGEGDPGRASTLYDARDRLGIYGQAYLAMALANLADPNGPADPRVITLLDAIAGQVHLTATGASWSEEVTDWRTMNTDIRTTSIVLAAFVRLQPENPLLPNVVRWLMSSRQAGRWATTQENAWAIIALTDWMAATGELEADYRWQVTLNGEELGSGQVDASNLDQPVTLRAAVAELLRDEANLLRLSRDSAAGQLYYTTYLRYFLDATAIPAADRGLVVSRSIQAAEGEQAGQPVATAKVGDVLSVTVTLVAPTPLHYLALSVPIPAGTEPIDVSLATTSQEFGGPSFGRAGPGEEGPITPWDWWRYWLPTHTDIRDEKVTLFADYLPSGTYEYTFLVRAGLPGEYRVLPAQGEEMYFPEVWGRSAGAVFTITEE